MAGSFTARLGEKIPATDIYLIQLPPPPRAPTPFDDNGLLLVCGASWLVLERFRIRWSVMVSGCLFGLGRRGRPGLFGGAEGHPTMKPGRDKWLFGPSSLRAEAAPKP